MEEESDVHRRELGAEQAKYKILQQKLSELELQFKRQAASHQQSREKSKEVLSIAMSEAVVQADVLRLELQQCSVKLSAAIDKNAATEQQVHSLETSLGEQERAKQQLLSSFEKQVRSLEASHKEVVHELAKELNDRDTSLLAITAAKVHSENEVKELGKQFLVLSNKAKEAETVTSTKEMRISELEEKLEESSAEYEKMKHEYESKLTTFRPYTPASNTGLNIGQSTPLDDGLGPSVSPPRMDFGHSPLRPNKLATPLQGDESQFGEEMDDVSPPHLNTDNQFSDDWHDKTPYQGVSDGQQEIDSLQVENERLRHAVSSMKQDACEMREMMKTTLDKGDVNEESVIQQLERRVEEAEAERDKLMSTSNALRGDLARLMSESVDSGSKGFSRGVSREQNQEASSSSATSHPEGYVESLEEAAQELVARNTALRKEVRRVEKLLAKVEASGRDGVSGGVVSTHGVMTSKGPSSEFEGSRVAVVRFGLLKPAIYGLFEQSVDKVRLSFDDLVDSFSNDTQAAQLLLGYFKPSTHSLTLAVENIANRASCVLRALGIRSKNETEAKEEGNYLFDVSAEELTCLWNVWAALGVYGVHGGITAFFTARASFSAAPLTSQPPSPPPVQQSQNQSQPSRPPQPPTQTQRRRQTAPPKPPPAQTQPNYQARVVRNYNDMRP